MLWVWLPVLMVFLASCHLKKKEVQECVCVCVCVCVCARAGVWASHWCVGFPVCFWVRLAAGRRPQEVQSLWDICPPQSQPGARGPSPFPWVWEWFLLITSLVWLSCFWATASAFYFLSITSAIYIQWRKLGNYRLQGKPHWLCRPAGATHIWSCILPGI